MTKKIDEILEKIDIEKFYRTKVDVKSKSGDELKCICPFHDETVGSFYANVKNGIFHCFGCGASGSIFQFVEKLEKVTFLEAVKILANFAGITISEKNKLKARPPIDPKLPNRYYDLLLKAKDVLKWIQDKRGLFDEAIKKYKLGWDGIRITIPIYDEKRVLRNIRRYSAKKKEKMISFRTKKYTYGEGRIYGLDEMLARPNETIHLHEGEFDKLLASQDGFLAVTGTVGAKTWKDEWTKYFAGRDVVVFYDMDPEGRKGADKVCRKLTGVAKTVKNIELPVKGSKDEKDYTDYRLKVGGTVDDVKKLAEETPIFVAPPQKGKTMEEKVLEENKQEKKFRPREFSLPLLKIFDLRSDTKKRFWIFDKEEQIWREDAELHLGPYLRKSLLPQKLSKRYYVAEILADTKALSFKTKIPKEPPPYLIPFRNKIYDLKKDKILDYSPKFFFINKLAVDLDEGLWKDTLKKMKSSKSEEDCRILAPKIFKVFSEIVVPDDIITLYEIAAYCLYRSYPYSKVFICYGAGANGKTAYANILRRMLGPDNTTQVSLDDLQWNRFAGSWLYGKIANICGELEYTVLKKTKLFKQATGGDRLTCDRKWKEQFEFKSYAKMIFLTNRVPATSDKSKAFYRRTFLVEFPREFFDEDKKTIQELVENLPAKEFEELGVLSLLILREMYQRKTKRFVFTQHKSIEAAIKEYEDLSDPIKKFLEERTEETKDGYIPIDEFKKEFIHFMEKEKQIAWNSQEINKGMRWHGYIQRSQKVPGERFNVRAWQNLRWKEK